MDRPLEGILVVTLEQAVAAPFCTSRLADAGARVIKIERAEGDFARGYDEVVGGNSAYFVWLNRGKESLTLDIKAEADRALLDRLIARADVFVQNLAPGATERAGIGSELLRERHPRLITCDISGYGLEGPYRDMKAYDLLIQCEAGLASITGSPDAPGRVGVSIADICCGMYSHAGILEALYRRQQTGEGTGLSVSLFDGIADWMAVPLLHQDWTGRSPARVGLGHPSIQPYRAYPTSDGQLTVLAIQNEREWRVFCRDVLTNAALAEDPRFAQNSLRCANREQLDAMIEDRFAQWSASELRQRLNDAQIAYGSVNDVAQLAAHPQLRRATVAMPGGEVALPAPAIKWAEGDRALGPVPALGAHSEAIRREFAA